MIMYKIHLIGYIMPHLYTSFLHILGIVGTLIIQNQ